MQTGCWLPSSPRVKVRKTEKTAYGQPAASASSPPHPVPQATLAFQFPLLQLSSPSFCKIPSSWSLDSGASSSVTPYLTPPVQSPKPCTPIPPSPLSPSFYFSTSALITAWGHGLSSSPLYLHTTPPTQLFWKGKLQSVWLASTESDKLWPNSKP